LNANYDKNPTLEKPYTDYIPNSTTRHRLDEDYYEEKRETTEGETEGKRNDQITSTTRMLRTHIESAG
jgi:hypothetical protein